MGQLRKLKLFIQQVSVGSVSKSVFLVLFMAFLQVARFKNTYKNIIVKS